MQAYTGGIPAGSGLFRLQFLTLLLLQELRVVRPCACVCTGLCACGCINTRGRLIFSLLLFPITPLSLPPALSLHTYEHTNTHTRTHIRAFSAHFGDIHRLALGGEDLFADPGVFGHRNCVYHGKSCVCVCVCVCDRALHVYIYK